MDSDKFVGTALNRQTIIFDKKSKYHPIYANDLNFGSVDFQILAIENLENLKIHHPKFRYFSILLCESFLLNSKRTNQLNRVFTRVIGRYLSFGFAIFC